jgi:hypothetical protein
MVKRSKILIISVVLIIVLIAAKFFWASEAIYVCHYVFGTDISRDRTLLNDEFVLSEGELEYSIDLKYSVPMQIEFIPDDPLKLSSTDSKGMLKKYEIDIISEIIHKNNLVASYEFTGDIPISKRIGAKTEQFMILLRIDNISPKHRMYKSFGGDLKLRVNIRNLDYELVGIRGKLFIVPQSIF